MYISYSIYDFFIKNRNNFILFYIIKTNKFTNKIE